MVVEVGKGLMPGVPALLSDAAHLLTKAVSIVLAWWRCARRGFTYGVKRATFLSVQVNGLTLLLAAWLAASVGDENGGAGGELARLPQLHQFAAQVLGGQDVEVGEGLVHHQHVGFHDEGPGEADALARAAGEFLGVGGLKLSRPIKSMVRRVTSARCTAPTTVASKPSSTACWTVSQGSWAKV